MDKFESHWKRMRFRGNKVWVAADHNGNPLLSNGRAIVKYQVSQAHEYEVPLKSLKHIDDKTAVSEKKYAKSDTIHIYIAVERDGKKDISGTGIFFRYKNHEKFLSRKSPDGTQTDSEIDAVKTALAEIRNPDIPVVVYSSIDLYEKCFRQDVKTPEKPEKAGELRLLTKKFSNLKFRRVKPGTPDGEKIAEYLASKALKKQPPCKTP